MTNGWRDRDESPGKRSGATIASAHAPSESPGKQTLTQQHEPTVQRLAGGPSAVESPTTLAAHGTSGPGGELPHLGTIQALFGRHDVSGVRAHDGDDAKGAAHGLGAKAFAVGNSVAFGESPDLRTTAHEAAHVVQQRSGHAPAGGIDRPGDALEQHADAVADAVVSGRSAEPMLDALSAGAATQAVQRFPGPMGGGFGGSSKEPEPEWRVKAGPPQDYVKQHAMAIIDGLRADMSNAAFVTGVEGVAWKAGSAALFNEAVNLQLYQNKADLWSFLVRVLAPDDVGPIVDHGRDAIAIPDQAKQYNNGVVFELEKAFQRRIADSLRRTVPRYAAVWNQHVFAAEKSQAGKRKHTDPLPVVAEPAQAEVRASAPIDPIVISALERHLAIDFKRYRENNKAENHEYEVQKLEKVSLEIQWQQRAIHWARATPPNASAEEVANELYGSETMAYLITPAAPLFGFDTSPENKGRLKQSYRDQIDRITGNNAYKGSAAPMPGTFGAEGEVLAGPLGDEAALNQSRHILPTPGASKAIVVERMRKIAGDFTSIQKKVARWGQQGLLDAAKHKVEARSQQLDKERQEARGLDWDGQTQVQVEVLGTVENAVEFAGKQADSFASFPGVGWLIIHIVRDYLEAAAVSDLGASAKLKLQAADDRSRQFPADLMDVLLDQTRAPIHSAMIEKTGAGGRVGDWDASRYGSGDLERKQNKLRHELTKMRELLLQDPAKAKLELQRLLTEITTLSTEVSMVADMDACEAAWASLKDNLSTVGEAVSVVSSSGNDLMREDMKAVTTMHEQWKGIYRRWKAAKDAGNTAQMRLVEEELSRKAKSAEWTELFNKIGKHIKDTQTINKWVTFGVMVGIALLTGGIGAYVEAGAGAAWGGVAGFAASTAVEAATFTSMSYLIVAKDPSLSGYFTEMGKSALMFGALKGLGKIYVGAVGEAVAESGVGQIGGILVQFTALNGHALYEADQQMRKAKGRGLTEDEILSISFENLAFIGALSLGSALMKPFLTGVALEGKLQGELIAVRNARAHAGDLAASIQAAKGKNIAQAKKLNTALADALTKEEALLSGLRERVKAHEGGDKSALSDAAYKQIKAAMGEHEAHVLEFRRSEVANLLEAAGPSQFYVARGAAFDTVVQHYGKVEKGTTVKVGPPDPVTGARTAEITNTAEKSTWRVTERMAAKEDQLARPPEAVSAGAASRPKDLGRSNHDGHEGAYVAETRVTIAGEQHHVRVKRLDSGEYILTLCSRCTRIEKLARGAITYLEELKKHGPREPHNQQPPKDVDKLLGKLGELVTESEALEKTGGKLKPEELEARTDRLAARLENLAGNPALEPVLSLGAEEVKPLGVNVEPTVEATLAGPAFASDPLSKKLVAESLTAKAEELPLKMARAALDAAKITDGSKLAVLRKANEHLTPDHLGRVEREAQRQIVDGYFDRLEAGLDAQLAAHAEAKTRPNDRQLATAQRAKAAIPAARAKALVELAEPVRYTNAGEWEASIAKLEVRERVALVKPMAAQRAQHFGWDPIETGNIKEKNQNRILYTDEHNIYSVDTQHGTFEVHDLRGKHLREINFDGAEVSPRDPTGQHDLKYK